MSPRWPAHPRALPPPPPLPPLSLPPPLLQAAAVVAAAVWTTLPALSRAPCATCLPASSWRPIASFCCAFHTWRWGSSPSSHLIAPRSPHSLPSLLKSATSFPFPPQSLPPHSSSPPFSVCPPLSRVFPPFRLLTLPPASDLQRAAQRPAVDQRRGVAYSRGQAARRVCGKSERGNRRLATAGARVFELS